MDFKRLEAREEAEKAREIYAKLDCGYNLPHTCQMIYYAECDGTGVLERQEDLTRTIMELELVYRENKARVSCLKDDIEELLNCAKGDVRLGEYWRAIYNVFCLEQIFLKEFLPELPVLNESFSPEVFLAKKIKLWVENSEEEESEEDPADWWKA